MAKAAIAYLELLAREAPTVEFEAPVLEARAAGASAAVVDELERARAAALRVRAVLDRSRRREAELSALFDTASDLALLHDLSAVLEAIVRRARTLLDADVAYMTLHDEDRGDTYMRVTDGSVSAHFQHVRLPMGAGLGGLVAQTATPYSTPSYSDDDGSSTRRHRHGGRWTRAWSRSWVCRCDSAAGSSGCCSPPTAARARSAATTCRCSHRSPRTPRWPSTTLDCSRRHGPLWPS